MRNGIKAILLLVVTATMILPLTWRLSAATSPDTGELQSPHVTGREAAEAEKARTSGEILPLMMIPKEKAWEIVKTRTRDTSYWGGSRPLRHDVVIVISSEIDPELLPMQIIVS